MTRPSRPALLVTAVLVAAPLSLTLSAAPAQALSCVVPATVLQDAEHVFAGRIADADRGRILVGVDEVWAGGPVPERTWLRVELAGWSELARDGRIPDGLTSTNRFVFATDDAVATTSPCSMWPERRVAQHRPAAPQEPEPGESEMPEPLPSEGIDRTLAAATGAGVAALTGGAAWLVVRRRRTRLSRGARLEP